MTPIILTQSRKASLAEACLNILIGYWVALLAQLLIFPLYNIQISLSTNLWIGFWFTLVSLIRSYALRRLFNHIHLKQHLKEIFHVSAAD